jgi:hypothetical protein
MINRYRRQARTWSELNLGNLVALDEAIPEFRDGGTGKGESQKESQIRGGNNGSSDDSTNQKQAVSSSSPLRGRTGTHLLGEAGFKSDNRAAKNAKTHGSEVGNRAFDVESQMNRKRECTSSAVDSMVDAALAGAIETATAAGDLDAILRIVEELRARRLAQAGEQVIKLARERSKRS